MLIKILKFLITASLLCISIISFAENLIPVKQIVILGDSYSDNGNTYFASKNTYPGPAYYFGHFSDGLNWAEYLSGKLGMDFANPKQFRNFAYGQAQTIGKITLITHEIDNPQIHWKFTIPDLAGEIDQYTKENDINPSNTLYFIFIGTNDFLNYIPTTKKQNHKFVQRELNALEKQVKRLNKLGAKHIVIFNIRDLSLSPLAKQLADKYKHQYIHKLNKMIFNYNKSLNNKYKKSKDIIIYNVYHFDQHIFNTHVSYQWYRQYFQLTEKTNPCYKNAGNYVDQVGAICNKPWEYLFYDRIHQTTFINKLLSDNLFLFLYKNHWRFLS